PRVDVGCRRYPAVDKVGRERRPVDARLALAEGLAEARVRHALPAAVRVEDVAERAADPRDHLCEWREMRRVLLGHEDVRMLGRQAVPPLVGRPVRLLGDEEAGDGLLLQPLSRITLGDARTFGERR